MKRIFGLLMVVSILGTGCLDESKPKAAQPQKVSTPAEVKPEVKEEIKEKEEAKETVEVQDPHLELKKKVGLGASIAGGLCAGLALNSAAIGTAAKFTNDGFTANYGFFNSAWKITALRLPSSTVGKNDYNAWSYIWRLGLAATCGLMGTGAFFYSKDPTGMETLAKTKLGLNK